MIRISTRVWAICAGTLLVVASFAFRSSLAQAPPAGTVALTGARVIDGTGRAPIEPATLVIENGRIAAVGTSVAIPAGATRIDMSGKTILPGLVNAHGHLNVDENTKLPVREHVIERLRVYSEYGVTTVASLGSTEGDDMEGLWVRAGQG